MTALFPALRSRDGHDAPLVWLAAEHLPRCTSCGHRQVHPVTAEKPQQTRSQHPRTWPAELLRRRQARNST